MKINHYYHVYIYIYYISIARHRSRHLFRYWPVASLTRSQYQCCIIVNKNISQWNFIFKFINFSITKMHLVIPPAKCQPFLHVPIITIVMYGFLTQGFYSFHLYNGAFSASITNNVKHGCVLCVDNSVLIFYYTDEHLYVNRRLDKITTVCSWSRHLLMYIFA